MSEIASRRATVLTLALFPMLAGASAVRAEVYGPLIVRVYDGVSNDAAMRADAIRTAATIVGQAGIAAEWRDCSGEEPVGGCEGYRRPGDLIVRFVPGAARIVGVRATVDEAGARAALGFSVVDHGRGTGALATIFLDRVHAVARRTGVDRASLLGRAIAHEIGHLLLGTSGHGRSGLMREVWTDAELAADRHDDWLFAEPERRRIQAGMRQVPAFAEAAAPPVNPAPVTARDPQAGDTFGR